MFPSRPQTAKIGPSSFELRWEPKNISKDYYGFFDSSHLTIDISGHYPEDRNRVTLLHELLHGATDVSGFNAFEEDGKTPRKYTEEEYITTVQRPLLMILQDNPEVVEWLCPAIVDYVLTKYTGSSTRVAPPIKE